MGHEQIQKKTKAWKQLITHTVLVHDGNTQTQMNRQIDANANKLVVKMCMVSKYNQQIAYERKEIMINNTKNYSNKSN